MHTPGPADVAAYFAFVAENLRQGREEWIARQRAAGFAPSTVSARIQTIDEEGRVIRRTVRDPLGVIEAYREQLDRYELGTATRRGGNTKGRKKKHTHRSSRRSSTWLWRDG